MKIAIFSGSTRSGSINGKLVTALTTPLKTAGFDVTVLSLSDYEMPLYNGDLEGEQGAPKSAKALSDVLKAQDAVWVVSPEYNGGLPPILKNTIDWLTRLDTMDHYHNPIWVISACTPGAMSGIMCMRQIQYILTRIGTQVLQFQMGVGFAAGAFNSDGTLARENDQSFADRVISALKSRLGNG